MVRCRQRTQIHTWKWIEDFVFFKKNKTIERIWKNNIFFKKFGMSCTIKKIKKVAHLKNYFKKYFIYKLTTHSYNKKTYKNKNELLIN